jgi:hypothetical protein
MKNDNEHYRIAVTELYKGKDTYAVAVQYLGPVSNYAVVEYFNGLPSDSKQLGLEITEAYRIMGGKVHWMTMNGYAFEK